MIQADGTLREYQGDVFKPRQTQRRATTNADWARAYFRAKNSKKGMTFTQAIGLFVHEHGYHPPMDLPRMPRAPEDLFRAVRLVPVERLR